MSRHGRVTGLCALNKTWLVVTKVWSLIKLKSERFWLSSRCRCCRYGRISWRDQSRWPCGHQVAQRELRPLLILLHNPTNWNRYRWRRALVREGSTLGIHCGWHFSAICDWQGRTCRPNSQRSSVGCDCTYSLPDSPFVPHDQPLSLPY